MSASWPISGLAFSVALPAPVLVRVIVSDLKARDGLSVNSS
ncbi:MAG: hypothetical protein WCP26_02925 [Actinomycetes bacterium]